MECRPKSYEWMHAPNQGYVTALEGAALSKQIKAVAAQAEKNKEAISRLQGKTGVVKHTYNDLEQLGFLTKGGE